MLENFDLGKEWPLMPIASPNYVGQKLDVVAELLQFSLQSSLRGRTLVNLGEEVLDLLFRRGKYKDTDEPFPGVITRNGMM